MTSAMLGRLISADHLGSADFFPLFLRFIPLFGHAAEFVQNLPDIKDLRDLTPPE